MSPVLIAFERKHLVLVALFEGIGVPFPVEGFMKMVDTLMPVSGWKTSIGPIYLALIRH